MLAILIKAVGGASATAQTKPTDGMILISEPRSGGRNTAVGGANAKGVNVIHGNEEFSVFLYFEL